METRDNDVAEVISEHHLQFMREYVAREEKLARACVERFLRERKPQCGAYAPFPSLTFVKKRRDASDLKQIKMPQNRS
jgi:hypothetical protein